MSVASTLARGLELAEGTELGLVILALRTPFATGAAIVEAVRRALPRQPLLIVCERSDADAKVRCLELGASDFLARPFAAAELVARVRIQLHRHAEAAGDGTLGTALSPRVG